MKRLLSLCVREITYFVLTIFGNNESRQSEIMYCLYFGSKQTEQIDQQATEANTVLNADQHDRGGNDVREGVERVRDDRD
jgi:hypothetical protein